MTLDTVDEDVVVTLPREAAISILNDDLRKLTSIHTHKIMHYVDVEQFEKDGPGRNVIRYR